MKRLLIISALFLAVSCGPSRYAVPVEVRQPSKSGLELAGKIITVAYCSSDDAVADAFNAQLAKTFAQCLEEDYGTGKGSITLHNVDCTKGNYAQRDSMFNILMETGADLVFLYGTPEYKAQTANAALPIRIKLYCYDGMNQEDKVISYGGTTVIPSLTKDDITLSAVENAKMISDSFVSQWKMEQYSLAYYDSQKWYDALVKAENFDWRGAMDIWLALLDTNDLMKRASAEYNLSVACFMLGDLELAHEWLEKSKADNDMPTLTDAMTKRIASGK
jgi:hypothetical protein